MKCSIIKVYPIYKKLSILKLLINTTMTPLQVILELIKLKRWLAKNTIRQA